jgi:hypothetical protein
MNSRQASGPGRRWEEALLGSVAGLGARVLLGSAARLLGFKSNPVAVGGMAGLVGALVGGRLARRQPRSEPEPPEAPGPRAEERAPRRGPNGRERPWQFQEGSSHTG